MVNDFYNGYPKIIFGFRKNGSSKGLEQSLFTTNIKFRKLYFQNIKM